MIWISQTVDETIDLDGIVFDAKLLFSYFKWRERERERERENIRKQVSECNTFHLFVLHRYLSMMTHHAQRARDTVQNDSNFILSPLFYLC